MFNLTDILQFIVYRFNNGSLAKHYPVLQRKFSSFNVVSHSCHKVNPIHKEYFGKLL